jgi:hypothetical protein
MQDCEISTSRRSRAGGNPVSSVKATGFPPARERRNVEICSNYYRFDVEVELPNRKRTVRR